MSSSRWQVSYYAALLVFCLPGKAQCSFCLDHVLELSLVHRNQHSVTGLSQRLGAVGQSEQWTKHYSLFPVPSRPLLEALIVS